MTSDSDQDSIMGSATEATSAVSGAAGSAAASAKDTLASGVSSAADMASSAPEQARRRTRGNPLVQELGQAGQESVHKLGDSRSRVTEQASPGSS